MLKYIGTLLIVVGLVVVTGCGAGKVKRYPVTGTLTYTGSEEPIPVGTVMFVSDTFTSKGKIQEDGTFTLGSYDSDDGAPSGEYQVYLHGTDIVDYEKGISKTYVDRKYTRPDTSGIVLTVETGDNHFDIEVDKPARTESRFSTGGGSGGSNDL